MGGGAQCMGDVRWCIGWCLIMYWLVWYMMYWLVLYDVLAGAVWCIGLCCVMYWFVLCDVLVCFLQLWFCWIHSCSFYSVLESVANRNSPFHLIMHLLSVSSNDPLTDAKDHCKSWIAQMFLKPKCIISRFYQIFIILFIWSTSTDHARCHTTTTAFNDTSISTCRHIPIEIPVASESWVRHRTSVIDPSPLSVCYDTPIPTVSSSPISVQPILHLAGSKCCYRIRTCTPCWLLTGNIHMAVGHWPLYYPFIKDNRHNTVLWHLAVIREYIISIRVSRHQCHSYL